MLKKSINSVLSKAFSFNAAPAAAAPMRSLSAAEIATVAGGPDYDHDVVPFAKTTTVPAK